MLFKILFYYFCGYVNISIEGYYIEKLINICISKKIFLWNLKRKKSTYLEANISIKDFKKIKPIIKKTRCKIHINKRKGFPFILNKYKGRKIFIISFIIIVLLIFITSRFIWNIEIIGNEELKEEEILELLSENGIKIGKYRGKINTAEIIRKIRLKNDRIAWISINLDGTNVIVKLSENTKKPDIINKSEYCNIISNKAGVITKINAKTGTIMVNVGDVVQEGSILVARMDGRKIYRKKIST